MCVSMRTSTEISQPQRDNGEERIFKGRRNRLFCFIGKGETRRTSKMRENGKSGKGGNLRREDKHLCFLESHRLL